MVAGAQLLAAASMVAGGGMARNERGNLVNVEK